MSLKCCNVPPSDSSAVVITQRQPCIGLGAELVDQQDLDRIFQHLGELLLSSRRIEQTLEALQTSSRMAPAKKLLPMHSGKGSYKLGQLSPMQCEKESLNKTSTLVADASDVLLQLPSRCLPSPRERSGHCIEQLAGGHEVAPVASETWNHATTIYSACESQSPMHVVSERFDDGGTSDQERQSLFSERKHVSFEDVNVNVAASVRSERGIIRDSQSVLEKVRKSDDIDAAAGPFSCDTSSSRSAPPNNKASLLFSSSSGPSSESESHGNREEKRQFSSLALDAIVSSHSVLPDPYTFRPSTDSATSSGVQTLMLPVSWPASIALRHELDADSKREIEELLRMYSTNRNNILRMMTSNALNGDFTNTNNIAHVKSMFQIASHDESTVMNTPSYKTILRYKSATNPGLFVLSPSSTFRVCLDFLSLLALCFDMLATPLVLAWDIEMQPDSLLKQIFWATCIFWTCDLLINFRTGFYFHGNLEMRPSMIARHYFRTWFIPDFVIVSGDWTSLLMPLLVGEDTNVGTLKLLRFSKSARLIRLLGILRMAKLAELFERLIQTQYLENHEMLARIPPLLLVVIWVNHLICCVWFALGRLAPTDTGLRWIDQKVAEDSDVSYRASASVYQYVTAFHWSLAQMTPGSMQVNASNSFERIYNNFCLVLGVICYSTLISLITSKMTHIKVMKQHKSSSLLKLRRFLRQNELPKDLRIAVQKQIIDRMARTKLLTVSDVDVLKLLSLSLRTELQYELCKPALESHPLFFYIDTISSTVLHHLCKDATEFAVIAAGDNVFLPGTEAECAYVLMRGGLSYTQDPISSKVVRRTRLDVNPRTWLCEVALWAHWTHVGLVEGTAMSELLVINVAEFTKSLRRHGVVWQLTQEYARIFHRRLVSCNLSGDCYPSDLKRPFEDFNELFNSMPKEIKVFIGLLTIELMQKSPWFAMLRRGILNDLRDQVTAGTCTLGLTDGNQVVRIVEVAALRLSDNDGYVFVHLGQIKGDCIKGRCQLPGAKVKEGEMSDVTIKRVMQEKVRLIADAVEIVASDLEVSLKDSISFKVSTKYLRTVYKGVLKDGVDVPGKSKSMTFRMRSRSKMSFRDTSDTGTKSFRDQATSSWSNTRHAQLPEYKDVLLSESDDTTYICGWVLESQFDYLSSPTGQEIVTRWIKGLAQVADCVSPLSTGATLPRSPQPLRVSDPKQKIMKSLSHATFGLSRSFTAD